MTAIALHGVTKRYGRVTALDGASVTFAPNRVHGLLGRNGAGKTTALRILVAQERASAGTVELFGEPPAENARVLARTCLVGESLRYPEHYRVRHALRAAAAAHPRWDPGLADRLAAEFELAPDQRCAALSRGRRSALGAVIGLASRAPLTVLDEPFEGLDAVARRRLYDRLLADVAEHPRTLVLSTHLIDEVSDLIEHVVLLDRGRVLVDEDTDALRGRAVTVSGPAESVERFVRGRGELHRERLGGRLRVTLRNADPEPAEADLRFEPVSLQQLVVHTTDQEATP